MIHGLSAYRKYRLRAGRSWAQFFVFGGVGIALAGYGMTADKATQSTTIILGWMMIALGVLLLIAEAIMLTAQTKGKS